MRYKAICFDFDYTLGDATDAIVAGFTHALTQMGWPAPEREAVRRTVGYMIEDAYTMLTGDTDPEHRQQMRPLFVEVAHPMQVEHTPLFPGAIELLSALRQRGVRLGVVSSKRTQVLREVMANNGALEYFELIVGSDAVSRHKPDPEGLLMAMEQLGAERGDLLYCGDTLIDADTAAGAGVDFCAVLNGTTTAADFSRVPHVHIAPDLRELARWLGVDE